MRYSGLVRCKLVTGLGGAVTEGADVYTSTTAGEGALTGGGTFAFVGRIYDASGYAVDETVILRLTCCIRPEQ